MAVSGNLVVVQADNGLLHLLDRDTGAQLRALKPPFAAKAARNLLVGGGLIPEASQRVQPGGKSGPTTLLRPGLDEQPLL